MRSSNKRNGSRSGLPTRAVRLILLAVLSALLVLCWRLGTRQDYHPVESLPQNADEMNLDFAFLTLTKEDQNTTPEKPEKIALDDCGTECLIEDAGAYRLSGTLDGTLRINAKGSTVYLLFDGVTIRSDNGPAVLIEDAGKVIITLADGSENSISDSGNYSGREDTEACVYSVSDLTINGSGSLTVHGFYKDAIRSKDVLKLVDGAYRIQCKRTGLHGNDGVNIAGGQVFIESEKNGIKTTKSGPEGRGCLVISGGTVSVVAGRYALVTEEAGLYIFDSTVQLNGVLSDFDVHGRRMIEEGCVT